MARRRALGMQGRAGQSVFIHVLRVRTYPTPFPFCMHPLITPPRAGVHCALVLGRQSEHRAVRYTI